MFREIREASEVEYGGLSNANKGREMLKGNKKERGPM